MLSSFRHNLHNFGPRLSRHHHPLFIRPSTSSLPFALPLPFILLLFSHFFRSFSSATLPGQYHLPLPSPPSPSSLPSSSSFQSFRRPSISHPPELPQCTDSLVLGSEIRTDRSAENDDGTGRANITSFVQLTTVTLGETICLMITANKSMNGAVNALKDHQQEQFGHLSDERYSMLHTLEYVRLELHYAITGTYKFAIPLITPRCKCDCAGGETVCSMEKYQYRNCSVRDALCYRTYRSGQSNTGCLTGGKADLCCQVEIRPYRKWSFQAIRLKQPSIVLVLRYRIFERSLNGGKGNWTFGIDEKIAIPLNRGATKFELNGRGGNHEDKGGSNGYHRVEISAAGGRPHRQMEPGMYFYKIDEADAQNNAGSRLRDGVALNGPGESNLEKLGWFRWNKGQEWTVRKGLEKITQAQHISVEDCKAQRYRATFNAEQFVLRGNSLTEDGTTSSVDGSASMSTGGSSEEAPAEERSNFDLGSRVADEPWVGEVRVGEREVVLEHAEGVALALTLRTESRPRIVHHSSQFSEFSGTIVLDKESNRYLNLTFHNARGTLIGQIFTSADSLSVMESIFSIDIGKMIVEKFQRVVATSVQSPRLVCFYPIGDLDGRKCHRLEFVWEPLQESPQFADQWQQSRSDCRGCNERGVESFLASLDPRQWLDGLNTGPELITCIVEIILFVVLLLFSLLLITKCVIPLCRCVQFVAKPAKAKKQPNG